MPAERNPRQRLLVARKNLIAALKQLPLPEGLTLSLDCEKQNPDREDWILRLCCEGESEYELHGRSRIRVPSGLRPEDPAWGRLLARGLARAIGSLAEQQTRGPVLAIWRPVEEESQALEGPRLLSRGFF